MVYKKKGSEIQRFILSDNAIVFIKKYVLSALNIVSPINEETLDKIVDLATQWEIEMIDPTDLDGGDKEYDYPERERNTLADKFVGEITGQWDDMLAPDFDDMNKRVGLIK